MKHSSTYTTDEIEDEDGIDNTEDQVHDPEPTVIERWWPVVAAGGLAIAILAGLLYSSGWLPGASDNARGTALSEHQQDRGTVILSNPNEVLAIDLTTNQRTRIYSSPPNDWWNPWLVSPDGNLVVKWDQRTSSRPFQSPAQVFDLRGVERYSHEWNEDRNVQFTGWLGNEELLFIDRDPQPESGTAESSLLAVHLETGAERELYRDNVIRALASDDGQHVAIVHDRTSPWPGHTLSIRPVGGGKLGEPVLSIENRFFKDPGHMEWTQDSQHLVFEIYTGDVPDPLPEPGGRLSVLSERDFVSIAVADTGGEFETIDPPNDGWLALQGVGRNRSEIGALVNPSAQFGDDWSYAQLSPAGSGFEPMDTHLAGSNTHWSRPNATWSPDGERFLMQIHDTWNLGNDSADLELNATLFRSVTNDGTARDEVSILTNHRLQSQGGYAILGWFDTEIPAAPSIGSLEPVGPPEAITEPEDGQFLYVDSAVSANDRFLIVGDGPSENWKPMLLHLEEGSGPRPGMTGWRDVTWFNIDPVAIATVTAGSHPDRGNYLVLLSSDIRTKFHHRYIDPVGISRDYYSEYWHPTPSPIGNRIAITVKNTEEERATLWIWDRQAGAFEIDSWPMPKDAAFEPVESVEWYNGDTLVYTRLSDWQDSLPGRAELMRASIHNVNEPKLDELTTFSPRGGDHGVVVHELVFSPNDQYLALRLRQFTSEGSTDDPIDSILVSGTDAVDQTLELARDPAGEGLIWLDDGDTLAAGLDQRIIGMRRDGRGSEFLTDDEVLASFPISMRPGEIWYTQRNGGHDQIMQIQLTREVGSEQ